MQTQTIPSMSERVRTGIQLLDKKVPGWRSRVEPDFLDMSSHENDLMSQIFGKEKGWAIARRRLQLPDNDFWRVGLLLRAEIDFPFGVQEAAYNHLTEIWLSELDFC